MRSRRWHQCLPQGAALCVSGHSKKLCEQNMGWEASQAGPVPGGPRPLPLTRRRRGVASSPWGLSQLSSGTGWEHSSGNWPGNSARTSRLGTQRPDTCHVPWAGRHGRSSARAWRCVREPGAVQVTNTVMTTSALNNLSREPGLADPPHPHLYGKWGPNVEFA